MTMNKTELLNKADELIKKADELIELANQEEILVPDNIKITESMMWYSMWLLNQNIELIYNYRFQKWAAIPSFETDQLIECKLTPCKYEDLKPWDLFYRGDEEDEDFGSPHRYAIKINDWSYQFWEGNNCINGSADWNYYWKIEPI